MANAISEGDGSVEIIQPRVFKTLDRLSRDWDLVCSVREALREAGPDSILTVAQRFDFFREFDDPGAQADHISRDWQNQQGDGWFPGLGSGVVSRYIFDGFMAAADLIREGGPYTSSWWLVGAAGFSVSVLPSDVQITIVVATPYPTARPGDPLPKNQVLAK